MVIASGGFGGMMVCTPPSLRALMKTNASKRPSRRRRLARPAARGRTHFLSCDWGTSVFRLRLVETAGLKVAAATAASEGILATNQAWLGAGGAPKGRTAHFLAVIRRGVARLEARIGHSLAGVPLVISGMASSSIGMLTLPYRKFPLALDASNLAVRRIAPTAGFAHPVLLVSGASTAADVMRGEETLLLGALAGTHPSAGRQVVILPGTHSKHVTVEGGRALGFATYMTGEFFALLSEQSILRHSVTATASLAGPAARAHFIGGVMAGARGNLLHECFLLRGRSLLMRTARTANSLRLSGLLIGAELQQLVARPPTEIVLVCGPRLRLFYEHGLKTLLPGVPVRKVAADRALLQGQRAVGLGIGFLPCLPRN